MINPIGNKAHSETEPPAVNTRPYRMHKEKPHSDTLGFQIPKIQKQETDKKPGN